MSPLSRTLEKLRTDCWFVAKTEHWNPFAKRRVDLFGFCDALAIKGNNTLAVQTTSGSHVAARITKIKSNVAAMAWLSGWPYRRITVHGWSKTGPRGKRKTWTCREVEVKPFTL